MQLNILKKERKTTQSKDRQKTFLQRKTFGEKIFLQRKQTNSQKAHEKTLKIANYQNASENYKEVSPHTSQNGHHPQRVNAGEDGEKVILLHSCWESKLVQSLQRNIWRFLKKLKTEPPHGPAIPPLGIYPEKTLIQKDTHSPVFTAVLFSIAKTWKQPKRPSTDEWIKM